MLVLVVHLGGVKTDDESSGVIGGSILSKPSWS